jgi:hypothetical protein
VNRNLLRFLLVGGLLLFSVPVFAQTNTGGGQGGNAGGSGTVTNVATSGCLTGGPITTTGTISSGATCALTSNPLSQFASTTSAQLASVISDGTGTGANVFANTPTLVTPILGAATGTSLNLGATGVLSTTAQSGTGSLCMTTNCAMTTPNLGTPSAVALTNATSFPAVIVQTGQTNVYGAFLQDFTAGTMEIPEAAGFTASVNSTIGLDMTANITHLWTNSADSTICASTATDTTTTHAMFATAVAGVCNARAIATGDLPAAIPIANIGTAGLSGTAPVTISAAGAIGCATCTTNASALTSNVIPKGNGGQALILSSMTDNGTNVTSTDTGGYIAPVFVSNGTTAGFIDLPQGTTSAAVAPCNTATSICFQAPTSVTSYLVTLAGAAATGIPHYANSSNVITETISAITSADATGNTSGSGNFCLVTSCTMVTPALGTPSALVLTNATGLPFSSIASATNTAAAMVIGTGASLTTSGTGTIATTTQFTNSAAGALSQAAMTLSGAPVTGGSGTTTFPLFYLNSGAAPTTFSTNGTIEGINAPSGFTGNFIDYHLNGGASVASISSAGALVLSSNVNAASITAASNMTAKNYLAGSNCSGVGTAANPSVASCGSSSAGAFSCATNASTGTCQVNTTGVGANSEIFVQEDDSLGTKLGVTCNTNNVLPAAAPLLGARSGGTSFTINLGTFTTNPLCYSYFIVNF